MGGGAAVVRPRCMAGGEEADLFIAAREHLSPKGTPSCHEFIICSSVGDSAFFKGYFATGNVSGFVYFESEPH